MNAQHIFKKRLLVASAAAIFCMGISVSAQARFILETGASQSDAYSAAAQVPSAFQSADRQPLDMTFMVGVRPGERVLLEQSGSQRMSSPAHISGDGQNVRFIEALSKVLPTGWQVYTEGDVDFNRQVSWSGNRAWTSVLNTLLNDMSSPYNQIKAVIDWPSREILIESVARDISPSEREQIAKANLPVFRVIPTKSLSENLVDWASRENWTVIWRASVDYRISEPRLYQGYLTAEGGAVDQLIAEYFTAHQPLRVRYNEVSKRIEVFDVK